MKRLFAGLCLIFALSINIFPQSTNSTVNTSLAKTSLVNTSPEIRNYISQCEFMLFSPSLENIITTSKSVLKRFYGRNYNEMLEKISTDSKSLYGLDILDLKNLESAGINIKLPIAYVHISNQTGYLLIPIISKKIIENFIKKTLSEPMPYKFMGNYICLSEKNTALDILENTNRLAQNEGYNLASQKLNFAWDRNFAWIESRYLSDVSSSLGVSSNIKIPYGFTALILDYQESKISVKTYSGIIDPKQTDYIINMRNVSASEKYNIFDYIWGSPAIIANIYLNVPMAYKYYNYIDTINILGIKGFVAEMLQKYNINIERDLINNTDGRLKMVVDKFDTIQNDYLVYGSLGIKDTSVAGSFMDSVKTAILQTDGKLYSFEMFTKPFYHYQSTNYSIYYGVIENEFVFSTDKDSLVQLVKNLYENKGGYAAKLPEFFRLSINDKKLGYFISIDIQSLFSNIKTSVEINKDFLVGIKEIDIYGNPDLDGTPYGWNTTIDINYYQ